MRLDLTGIVTVQHYRRDVLLSKQTFKNAITNEGKNALLDIMFNGETPVDPWYIGLSDDMSSGNINVADDMSSHTWAEFEDYDEATREEWILDSAGASSQEITNANSLAEFTIDATGSTTISGCFVASLGTIGGVTGTLWSTGVFDTQLSLENDDVIKVQYKVSVA